MSGKIFRLDTPNTTLAFLQDGKNVYYLYYGKKTGEMAAKVLLGKESISSMPIAYDEAPVKKYNEEICRDLGLSVPEDYQKIGG